MILHRFCLPRLAVVLVAAAAFAYPSYTPAADADAKPTLKVIKVDSEETTGEDGKGANAVDGDPQTIWHTQWQDASPTHPHEIVIQLDPPTKIKGLTYLPRQGEQVNGTIKEYEVYLSKDGKDFGKPVKTGEFEGNQDKKTVSFDPAEAAFVKLVAKSEINGEAWASAAEIGVVREGDKPTGPATLKLVKVDSEETTGEDGKGANAVDGKPDTFWHTQWQDASPAHPHEIVIALGSATKIKGLTYLPRQDDNDHGNIKEYEVYLSKDGKDFGKPVKTGELENSKDKKTIEFDPAETAFVKLVAKSEVNGEAWTSAAEIGVVPADEK
jgi:hypothetical protein